MDNFEKFVKETYDRYPWYKKMKITFFSRWGTASEWYYRFKYSLQRALKGYSDNEVIDVWSSISDRMVLVLTEFRKYNIGTPRIPFDEVKEFFPHSEEYEECDGVDYITLDLWHEMIDHMIYYFSNEEDWRTLSPYVDVDDEARWRSYLDNVDLDFERADKGEKFWTKYRWSLWL